jgi:hypothetical protein
MASLDFDDIPAAAKTSGISFDDLPTASVRRQAPAPQQELSLGERIMTSLPKGVQDWFANPHVDSELFGRVNLGRGSAVHGFAMGAADPVVGAAQLVANLPGINGAISQGPTLSDLVLGRESSHNPVNQAIDAKNADYEAARAGQGRGGFDAARLVGGLVSPANVAVGAALPVKAVTTGGRIWQGARAGAAGAALAPVANGDDSFLREKVGQVLTGAVAGGVLTPVAGKVGDWATRKYAPKDPADLAQQADDILRRGINRVRQDGMEVSPAQIAHLRQQVIESLNSGVEIDAAAALRKADFEALGMQPMLGQITRDAATFSREKNLRGVAGVGDPLMARYDQQSARLHELISSRSAGAADNHNAGEQMMSALKGVDDDLNAKVGLAYDKARDHLGRAAPMDSAAFSKMANLALDEEMLGSSLPAEARKILNNVTLGKIPLNVNSAVLMDRRLSELQRDAVKQNKGTAAKAIGAVRNALNKTPIADNVGEDAKAAFDTARGMALGRFKALEMTPALKAASEGDVAAEDFTRRFLINGKVEDVTRMAKVLTPDMRAEARRQFGAAMDRAAFGEDAANSNGVAQESFNKFLRSPGMRQKLAVFFSGPEIEEFYRIGRVAAYRNSFPDNSTVNTSNTASAVMNLITRIPGMPAGIGLIQSAKTAAKNQMAVNSSMAASAEAPAGLTPRQLELLARTLGSGTAGVSGAAGKGVGK